jgi:hypothetical protein
LSVIHRAYLFDYEQFRAEVSPLVQDIERGDSKEVRERALSVLSNLRKQNQRWILEDPWSNPTPNIASWAVPLTPLETGLCLLVLLSQYLEEPKGQALGLRENWPMLHAGLVAIGWSERETKLAITGGFTRTLLYPEASVDRLVRPYLANTPSDSDFSWWLTTGYGGVGWLDSSAIATVHERLLLLRGQLATLKASQLLRSLYPTTGTNPTAQQVLAAYDNALEMYDVANNANKGLFMTIS